MLCSEARRALLLSDRSSDAVQGAIERANRWLLDSCFKRARLPDPLARTSNVEYPFRVVGSAKQQGRHRRAWN